MKIPDEYSHWNEFVGDSEFDESIHSAKELVEVLNELIVKRDLKESS